MSFGMDISSLGTYIGQTITSLGPILLTVLGLVVGFGIVGKAIGLFKRGVSTK